ncbi:MAG: PQQ-binding-like beta-propeller repeat protein [Treponema sp.]|nr:PQQ-binding-like beta-propeller repeat protein [Treponema sp.]MCL2237101.1 PQQ-binding-like beta-propeller repeat protein [Treponema sp.]
MRCLFGKIVFMLIISLPLYSQSSEREQALVTSDPYWRQALGGAVISLPSVQVQSAVVALDGGNIRAYSTSGNHMWNYSARGRISPFVSRSREGTSYLSRTNGTLIAVNRAGRELWRRSMDAPLCAKVIVGWDGRLFAPTSEKIYCYTASGTLLWTKILEAPILVAPKLDKMGGILFALNNNAIYRMDPFGNTQTWPLAERPGFLISLDRNRIIILYVNGAVQELGASEDWFISAQSGEHSAVMPWLPSGPLAAVSMGNNIAATVNDGRVVLLSVNERRILWTANSHIRELSNSGGRPDNTEVEMICDERGIYVLSRNGATGFAHNGTRHWFTYLNNAASVPAFGNDGVLYSGTRDWILYAYRIEDRVLPERNALYGPVPDGTYGMGRPRHLDTLEIPLNESEKRAKLEEITAAASAGTFGANEIAWTSFLLEIAAGQEPLQSRIGALNLLGKIGSQETIPWLINIFRRDTEPLIRGAAINAIGEIGVDPQGLAIQTFLFSVVQNSIRDEHILTAIASATGALCRFSGPPLSETGVRILNLLSASNQPAATRRQANRELASLR